MYKSVSQSLISVDQHPNKHCPVIYSLAFNKPKSRDNIGLKFLVYTVLLMEIIQSAFVIRDAFVTFASKYGNPAKLGNVEFTWLTMPVLSGIGKPYHHYQNPDDLTILIQWGVLSKVSMHLGSTFLQGTPIHFQYSLFR